MFYIESPMPFSNDIEPDSPHSGGSISTHNPSSSSSTRRREKTNKSQL